MDYLDQIDVVWNSPSVDSSGSMPLGNGDIALNAWVERDGDLLFYLSKADAWDENGRLAKLGRIRISLRPNPFRDGLPFSQRLHLRGGEIQIAAGALKDRVDVRLWIDANRPVVQIQINSKQPIEVAATAELCRTQTRELVGRETHGAIGHGKDPTPLVALSDLRLAPSEGRIAWCHRNISSFWPSTLHHQGMAEWAVVEIDPLLYRTFGASMEGSGMSPVDSSTLRSISAKEEFLISVHALTTRAVELEDWTKLLQRQIERTNKQPIQQARTEHAAWWEEFWERSYIRVSGDAMAEAVTRGYALQRFISACAGRGAYPIKFNGSLFTVDARDQNENLDADYRRWGGCYWFQNTRLIYWPMLAAGDIEMMRPLFRMYLDALPMALERTRTYFSHAGAFFPETMYFWGSYLNSDYGWDRTGHGVGEVRNRYIRYYFSGGLELLAMLLEHELYVFTEQFAKSTLLPLTDAIITFYDRHYARVNGKIRFEPAQSLETWQEAVDPLPEIAGLTCVLSGLLRLPRRLTSDERRSQWERLLSELPVIPMRKGAENLPANYLIPAAQYDQLKNCENPELYAVFPYRMYGVGKPDLAIGLRTFDRREFRNTGGWQQDAIQAALLGLADEAKAMVTRNFTTSHAGSRFSSFWGPNFDWVPDQDHGCVAMLALQYMLLQCEGERILVLPAWPDGWDAEWKLHAPMRTTVEGVVRGGELRKLTITPEVREKDVILAR
jgi:alpha-L-fucosidase 2